MTTLQDVQIQPAAIQAVPTRTQSNIRTMKGLAATQLLIGVLAMYLGVVASFINMEANVHSKPQVRQTEY